MLEIPTSYKIALTVLFSALVGIFVFSFFVNNTHAYTSEYAVGVYPAVTTFVYGKTFGDNGYFSNSGATLPLRLRVRCSVETELIKLDLPITQLYTGAVSNSKPTLYINGVALATSSMSGIDGSSASTNRYINNLTYFLPSGTICNETPLDFFIDRPNTGTFQLWDKALSTSSSTTGIEIKDNTYATNTRNIYFTLWASSTVAEECGILECDMSSTTEAIYTVGQVNSLYWAILFLLIFGFIGYSFTSGYLYGNNKRI